LRGGSALRLLMTADGLTQLGPVDLFVVTNPGSDEEVPGAEVARRTRLAHRVVPAPATQAVRWLGSRMPAHLGRLDLTPAARDLREWAAPRYDLVWLYKPEAWVIARRGGVPTSGAVCDLDDLDDLSMPSVAFAGV